MDFVEFPKWVRAPGHADVLVNSAEEEAATLRAWEATQPPATSKPSNPLLAQSAITLSAAESIAAPPQAPAEPRAHQLSVEIPDNWRDLPFLPRKAGAPSLKSLAAKVSNGPVTDKASAIAAVEAELARRQKGE